MALRHEELSKEALRAIGKRIREIEGLALFALAKDFAAFLEVDEVTLSRWKKGGSIHPQVPSYIARRVVGRGSLSDDWEEVRRYILDGGPLPLAQTRRLDRFGHLRQLDPLPAVA